jgi:predicted dinucleotide-binding enzyme
VNGIAQRLATAGHTVLLTDHNDGCAASVAQEIGDASGSVFDRPLADVLGADVVALALWYPGTVDFAREHSTALAGKTVIDIANPLDASYTRLTTEPTTSAAEDLAAALPDSVIIKAFNTVSAPTLFAGSVDGTEIDTFIAGDDQLAKDRVAALLAGSGLRTLDSGALENARLLERLCAFGIELGQRYGLGMQFGISTCR